MILATEQVNAAGGVKLGGVMRPLKLEIIDTRDQEPGVPTSEVLLAMEKLVLDKGAKILAGGPIMSEGCLAVPQARDPRYAANRRRCNRQYCVAVRRTW